MAVPARRVLASSAPLARRWAREYCENRSTGAGCARYHGLRQYWRILDLVTTPAHHSFYAENIRSLVVDGSCRNVLISGCADYAQLAQLQELYSDLRRELRVTVVDQCQTPLALCHWYADRVGLSIETRCTDIRTYSATRHFDLICTHSFLSWFPPAERLEIAVKWYELLRPGGSVVTVNRIRPPTSDAGIPVRHDEKETDDFCARVLERARQRSQLLDVTPEQLAVWAKEYRAGKSTYGVRSRTELEHDFRNAGFSVETASLGSLSRQEWRRERDERGEITYVGVMARRPGECGSQATSDLKSSNLPPGPRSIRST